VVAIDHGGNEERNNEYTVYFNEEYQFGGKGMHYIAFLVETLKPFIDSQYRTLPEPESTIIAGSSFGAYISLFAAVKHQDVFGKVGAFSLMMWQEQGQLIDLITSRKINQDMKIYISIGANEIDDPSNNKLVNDLAALTYTTLNQSGAAENGVYFDVVREGKHHEDTWKGLFPVAFKWLLQ